MLQFLESIIIEHLSLKTDVGQPAANIGIEPKRDVLERPIYKPRHGLYLLPMSRDDWYRNEVWNSEIKKGFLSKLSKARSQRDQCLKVQIHHLTKSYPLEALLLCDLYRDTRSDPTWDLGVEEAAAKAYEALGEVDKAVSAYRGILKHNDSKPFFPTSARLDDPYLIARKGPISDFPFAFQTLARAQIKLSEQGLQFAVEQFVFHASHALIRHRINQKQEAKEYAVTALKAACVTETGLRYHRKVGLVGSEHQPTLIALKSITSGYPRWLLRLMTKIG